MPRTVAFLGERGTRSPQIFPSNKNTSHPGHPSVSRDIIKKPNSSNIHYFRSLRGDQQRHEGRGGLSALGGEDDQLLGCDPDGTV
jgi:hypothetical protein